MSENIRKNTNPRTVARLKRKKRVRSKIFGTGEKPRLSFFKGSRAFFIQFIDDVNSRTILGLSSVSKGTRGKYPVNKEGAKSFAKFVAEKAKEKGIKEIVFDRNGYKYHGIVKEFADSLREEGLKF